MSDLKSRLDNRSIEEFMKNLETRQKQEHIAAKLYCLDQKIELSKLEAAAAADYSLKEECLAEADFIIDGFPVEIKVHSEKFSKISLKELQVKKYYEDKINILVFRETYGVYIPWTSLKSVMKYKTYTDPSVYGGKPHYKIMSHHLEVFYEENTFIHIPWSESTINLIDNLKNKDLLF